jgi:3'-phosphoadenosine 5'-phosphosulfate sulfotransferase (PAPS reductase)/FAD synthetase
MIASPYTLPDGKVQVGLSGGRTSARMLWEIRNANGGELPDRVCVVFTNTGREMAETLDFLRDIENVWGVEVVWLEYRPAPPWFEIVSYETASRNGEPFEAMIRKERYLPNQSQRIWTKILKVLTAKRFLVSKGWKNWTSAIGFRADEMHRVKKPKRNERWTNWYPLADAGVSKHSVIEFWEKQNFNLRLMTVNGSCPDGNCDGCFLKSQAHLAGFYRRLPDRAEWWPRMEAMATDITDKPSGARFNKAFARRELHEFIEKQSDWIFNDEAYLCQASGGECLG